MVPLAEGSVIEVVLTTNGGDQVWCGVGRGRGGRLTAAGAVKAGSAASPTRTAAAGRTAAVRGAKARAWARARASRAGSCGVQPLPHALAASHQTCAPPTAVPHPHPNPSPPQLRTFAARDGSFALRDVPPGRHVVSAYNTRFVYPEARAARPPRTPRPALMDWGLTAL